MAKKKAQKFNPLKSPYQTQKQFNTAVNQRARGQIQPGLNDIKQRGTEALGAHNTREGQLGSWYGAQNDALTAANTGLGDAYAKLVGASGQAGLPDALNAALRQSNAANDQAAANLGVSMGDRPDYAGAIRAYAGANQMGLTGDMASELTRSAGAIATGGIAGRQAKEEEGRRYDTVNKGLQTERKNLLATLPGIISQTRSQMLNDELNRAGQAFQQNLANRQFGLQNRQFGEDKKQNKFQRGLANRQLNETVRSNRAGEKQARINERHNYAINKKQVAAQNKEINARIKNATTDEDKQKAQLAADRFNNGVAILANALDPKPFMGKNGKLATKRYQASYRGQFGAIMNRIMAATGLGELGALKVMMTASDTGWANHARDLYKRTKARRAQDANPNFVGPPTPTPYP